MEMYPPRDLVNLRIELPPLLEAVTVLHGRTLARVDDTELVGRVRLPHAHDAVIGAAQDEPRVGGEESGRYAGPKMSTCAQEMCDKTYRCIRFV